MADKNRRYAVVVLYDPAGSVQSHCITETAGQAESVCRTYRRHHAEAEGWKIRVYPASSRQEARRMTPPALPAHADTPPACIRRATRAVAQTGHDEAHRQKPPVRGRLYTSPQ